MSTESSNLQKFNSVNITTIEYCIHIQLNFAFFKLYFCFFLNMKYIVVLQVFAPTFQRCTMLFRSLMNRFQISEEEIVALFGLLFWNERNLSDWN